MSDGVEPQVQEETGGLDPLFSLVAGEGDGIMLGIAAGDAAGGAWELGYSAVAEQATVIAYHLIEHRQIVPDELRDSLLELDGSRDEDPVYRSETASFREWLDSAGGGNPVPSNDPLIDGVARSPIVGVAFRQDPDAVIKTTLSLARLFDDDGSSLIASMIASTAAAASCFGQSGRDLVAAVQETVVPAVNDPDNEISVGLTDDDLNRLFTRLIEAVGVSDAVEALEVAGGNRAEPVQMAAAGLLLAAPAHERFHLAVEQSARLGGSVLGAFAGGLVGARVGIKGWPWAFANDTWFAEIGRRLVRGPDRIEDLPIPYAVEQHLMFGPRPGFH